MRSPQDKVIIICAVTGNLTTPEQTPHLPITPAQIADACLGAADAGAAIVHIHVRDPLTGRPSMLIDHYVDVVERIRARNPALILNITTGPGGRFVPSRDDPKVAAEGTTLMVPEKRVERVEHIAVLRPDICTLDLKTMNSGREVVINTPANVRRMAKVIADAGVKPEIELFDSGDIALMRDLLADGTLQGPVLCSFVMGVRYGFQPAPETVLYARDLLPPGAEFTAVGIRDFGPGRKAKKTSREGRERQIVHDGVDRDLLLVAPGGNGLLGSRPHDRRVVRDPFPGEDRLQHLALPKVLGPGHCCDTLAQRRFELLEDASTLVRSITWDQHLANRAGMRDDVHRKRAKPQSNDVCTVLCQSGQELERTPQHRHDMTQKGPSARNIEGIDRRRRTLECRHRIRPAHSVVAHRLCHFVLP
jgi:3-dehydrocarnitine:acetyl-CoA trimethylamine transferase